MLDEKGDGAGGLGAKRGFDIDWKTDLDLDIDVIIDLGGVRFGMDGLRLNDRIVNTGKYTYVKVVLPYTQTYFRRH